MLRRRPTVSLFTFEKNLFVSIIVSTRMSHPCMKLCCASRYWSPKTTCGDLGSSPSSRLSCLEILLTWILRKILDPCSSMSWKSLATWGQYFPWWNPRFPKYLNKLSPNRVWAVMTNGAWHVDNVVWYANVFNIKFISSYRKLDIDIFSRLGWAGGVTMCDTLYMIHL